MPWKNCGGGCPSSDTTNGRQRRGNSLPSMTTSPAPISAIPASSNSSSLSPRKVNPSRMALTGTIRVTSEALVAPAAQRCGSRGYRRRRSIERQRETAAHTGPLAVNARRAISDEDHWQHDERRGGELAGRNDRWRRPSNDAPDQRKPIGERRADQREFRPDGTA